LKKRYANRLGWSLSFSGYNLEAARTNPFPTVTELFVEAVRSL
jgi:hypothetical protein